MLYKLLELTKIVVLYGFLFVASGSLLEASQAPKQNLKSVALSSAVTVSEQRADNSPQRLTIPRLGIYLTVIPGVYDPPTKTWTLTDTNVQFASMTTLPNERSGDTLLYGHNTSKVLAPTDQLVEGDTAQVTTRDGRTFNYVFTGSRLVDPSDTSVLKQTNSAPTLTLLTCDGLWDEKRRLMTFDFVKVS